MELLQVVCGIVKDVSIILVSHANVQIIVVLMSDIYAIIFEKQRVCLDYTK